MHRKNKIIGGGESPTFTTSNSEEKSKIKFYFLLRHYILFSIIYLGLLKYLLLVCR